MSVLLHCFKILFLNYTKLVIVKEVPENDSQIPRSPLRVDPYTDHNTRLRFSFWFSRPMFCLFMTEQSLKSF